MNNKRLEIAITMLTLLAVLPVLPTLAASFTVTTDKTSYVPNDSLVVKGTVDSVTAGQDVTIIVYGPTSERKAFDQITPAANGSYSKTVMVFQTYDPSGVWTVTATYGGAQASAMVTFTGVTPPPAKKTILMDVSVDVGAMLFKGETAEFYILTSNDKVPIVANLTYALYGPTAVTGTLSTIANGVYKVSAAVPANATVGTYAIVVNATHVSDLYEGKGIGMKSFLVSSRLTSLNDDIGTLKTDVSSIKTSAAAANTAATAAKAAVDGMSTMLYAAVFLALIAAVAAIASVVQITRKIAG